MGRNIHSVCHFCDVKLMHFRGQESDHMMQFQRDHEDHEKMTEIMCDYVKEPPEYYKDVFDEYNPEFEKKLPRPNPGR